MGPFKNVADQTLSRIIHCDRGPAHPRLKGFPKLPAAQCSEYKLGPCPARDGAEDLRPETEYRLSRIGLPQIGGGP